MSVPCRIGHGLALIILIAGAASVPSRGAAGDAIETGARPAESQSASAALAAMPPPLTQDQATLAAIQEEGRRQVAELVQAMDGFPHGQSLEALQSRIRQIKKDSETRFLTMWASLAWARADEPAAREAERCLAQILRAPVPPDSSMVQFHDKDAAQQGGKP